ncbi:MAG TPA: FkbM family methyltransferase, partial [Steroidobacteraceae bacterium]|nr:FkbM family methyltransferase [Steroidobacteraceae bacterium]
QDIDCILDVGANVGQYHDFLRDKVLYRGPIVSFEPIGRNIDRLRERARFDSAWHIEGYALGAAEGALPLNVMVSDQFSSFLEPDHSRVVPLRRRPPVRLICEARDWGSAVDAMIVSTERKWT